MPKITLLCFIIRGEVGLMSSKVFHGVLTLLLFSLFLIEANPSYGKEENIQRELKEEIIIKRLEAHTQILNLKILSTKMKEIEITLGKAAYSTLKQNHHQQKIICYKSISQNDNTAIYFYDNAMSGIFLQKFEIFQLDPILMKRVTCVESQKINKEIHTKGGIQLGMTRSNLLENMGISPKSAIKENPNFEKIEFEYIYLKKMSKNEIKSYQAIDHPYFVQVFYAKFKLFDEKIISMSISLSSTY